MYPQELESELSFARTLSNEIRPRTFMNPLVTSHPGQNQPNHRRHAFLLGKFVFGDQAKKDCAAGFG